MKKEKSNSLRFNRIKVTRYGGIMFCEVPHKVLRGFVDWLEASAKPGLKLAFKDDYEGAVVELKRRRNAKRWRRIRRNK